MDDWQRLIITAAVYLAIAAFGAATLGLLWLFTDRLRRPWLPLQRMRRVPWHGIDVFTIFVTAQIVPLLVDESLLRAGFFDWVYGEPAEQIARERRALWSMYIGWTLVLGLIVLGLRQIRAARLADMGMTLTRAAKNAASGYVFWLILLPTALGIFELSEIFSPAQWSDEHPMERAARESLSRVEWALLIVLTIVVASVVEEIVFRGILLPWQLQSGWEAQAAVAVGALMVAILAGSRDQGAWYNPMPVFFVLALLPAVFWLPFVRMRKSRASNAEFTPPGEVVDGQTNVGRMESTIAATFGAADRDRTRPGLAIFTNGLLFAALHSSVWPSPVPLLFLGVGLAWLAYRTSSLIGPISLHAFFNAVAAFSLLVEHFWR